MRVPVFADVQYVKPDGYLTSDMQIYHDQLNQMLQNGLSDNGWTLPVITAANLALIQGQMPNGTIWAVSDPAINPTYNEIVVKLDDGSGTGTSALYKLTKAAYP